MALNVGFLYRQNGIILTKIRNCNRLISSLRGDQRSFRQTMISPSSPTTETSPNPLPKPTFTAQVSANLPQPTSRMLPPSHTAHDMLRRVSSLLKTKLCSLVLRPQLQVLPAISSHSWPIDSPQVSVRYLLLAARRFSDSILVLLIRLLMGTVLLLLLLSILRSCR
jgi:hypothetical protein